MEGKKEDIVETVKGALQKKEPTPEEKEEMESLAKEYEEIKMAVSGISDPAKYLEQELKDLKLDDDQRQLLKDALNDEGSSAENVKKLLTSLKTENKGNYKALKKIEGLAPLYDAHDFWDSQPVPKAYENIEDTQFDKPIDLEKQVTDIRATPYNLPAGFEWSEIDMSDKEQVHEVYELLTQNYVEDDDNMFRFDYSVEFLQWALTPPGYKKDWLFGVRGGKKNRLFGFISGIPVHMNIRGKPVMTSEINFLCVHKNLRTKRLAPVLIKEVTRRVNQYGIW